MNGRSSSSGDWVLPMGGIFVGIFLYAVWQFSLFFHVDFATGLSMVIRFGVWGLVFGAIVFLGRHTFFDIRRTWPFFLACAWLGVWPAIEFHAHQGIPSFLDAADYLPWWGRRYTEAGGFAAFLVGGYVVKNWWD